MKHKPIKIVSINKEQGLKLSDLEMFFLVTQDFIQKQLKNGKKGKKLTPEDKITYEQMQGILFALHSEFGLKGCFSFGVCETCSNFDNSMYSSEFSGKCKGKDVHCFDSCSEHSDQGGGFGL